MAKCKIQCPNNHPISRHAILGEPCKVCGESLINSEQAETEKLKRQLEHARKEARQNATAIFYLAEKLEENAGGECSGWMVEAVNFARKQKK